MIPPFTRGRRPAGASLLLVLVAAVPGRQAVAQSAAAAGMTVDQVIQAERFVRPPVGVAEAVLAPRYLNVTLSDPSPDRRWFLNEIGDGPVKMDVFSRPFHELGGLFIDYRANRNRTLTIRNSAGLELISGTDGARVPVQIPDGLRISNPEWSPDGKSVAFFGHTPDATHLWVADAATGRARQVTRTAVLATLDTDFEWMPDGKALVTVLIPEGRSPMPVDEAVPAGPQVKLAEESDKNHLRTYASLMATPHDKALLEWHVTGQLAAVDVQSRRARPIGAPTMVQSFQVSPDGMYVRVTRMTKPFSYVVPVNNFGTIEEVWGMDGTMLVTLNEEPLNLGVDTSRTPTAPGVGGSDGAQAGPREIAWRPDGQGLTFLLQEAAKPGDSTARDDSDPNNRRNRRKDRVMSWVAPFDSAHLTSIYENENRLSGHRYSADGSVLFASERTGQSTHQFAVKLSDPSKKHTLARYRADDVYANPGSLVNADGTMPAGFGFFGFRFRRGGGADEAVALSSDGAAYLYGTQYDKNPLAVGPRTFIDKVTIEDGHKTRLFESDNDGVYERVLAYQDLEAKQLYLSREGTRTVPQSYRSDAGRLTQLTQNQDYTPDLTAAPRESFVVERPDGFKFKVDVTLPPNYQPGTKLPAMFWFYPREYAGQEEYDRGARTFNRNAFPNFGTRSIEYLVRLGYAVVEPDSPIIGENRLYNNNYENDLRNNLATVIDSVEARGLVDRSRIAIGGHSYGAFSTVNAMVHTPFFKAGIAGDGNYNRTLTPLNFQNERRDLWEARETYLAMSPLLHANNLTGALLMYHGLGDQNVGTHPSHSPRLFHALNGLGKTTSMYLYPFEDHGPATEETLLDLWARWSAWLDKYVKHAGSKDKKSSPVSEP
ncbi:MAG: prolyl oligopeptidase family serine peptidase [Gemmatimonadales bacterium]